MLYYDRIGISERIDLAKSNISKACMICHYWYLITDLNFKILYAVVVMMLSVNISSIAIITGKNVDYRCNIHNISKSKASNLL